MLQGNPTSLGLDPKPYYRLLKGRPQKKVPILPLEGRIYCIYGGVLKQKVAYKL